ncbi:SDR family oxidoreductase [Nocardia sp. CA-135398]|uniref:SDR family oxidoreductase n=1 Tax=Nocardia sp. CA-135398 TaxID=3239977 RepID=UPI003D98EB89
MQVAVIGGTGVLGASVVRELNARGHQVRVVSRTAPADRTQEHRSADLATGSGLESALDGCDTVVDAVSARSRTRSVMVDGVRRLLAAEKQAGIGHHVEISIVGCDLVPFGYYRAKVEQEQVVSTGEIPWTLLRASQFHELVTEILAASARWRLAPRSSAKIQPIDVDAVATRLADTVDNGPAGRIPDIAGPTVHTLTELADIYRAHTGRKVLPLPVPIPGRAGRALRSGALCLDGNGDAIGIGYAEWLSRRLTR